MLVVRPGKGTGLQRSQEGAAKIFAAGLAHQGGVIAQDVTDPHRPLLAARHAPPRQAEEGGPLQPAAQVQEVIGPFFRSATRWNYVCKLIP